MTKKESKYLDRLNARLRILDARLEQMTPESHIAYTPTKQERDALDWGIRLINASIELAGKMRRAGLI